MAEHYLYAALGWAVVGLCIAMIAACVQAADKDAGPAA